MRAFAELLDGLVFTPQRHGKLRLIQRYLAETPDPDRGYAVAALTGDLSFNAAKPGAIRALAQERVDGELFRLSYDYVGDLAETVALIWPAQACPDEADPPRLSEVVAALGKAGRQDVPALLAGWFDRLQPSERFALIKLITGGLRVGVSARLAKTALAGYGGVSVAAVEQLWHAQPVPFAALLAWLDGAGPPPAADDPVAFRPPMLAHPLADGDRAQLDPAAYRAEWKFDGIRVQFARFGERARLYTRTGEAIDAAFPDIVANLAVTGCLDGELLVMAPEASTPGQLVARPFNALQQRLNRKRVSRKLLADYPAFLRAYDLLADGESDLRPLAFDDRRARLEAWYRETVPEAVRHRLDLSPLIAFTDLADLDAQRQAARRPDSALGPVEGVMLKRADSAYVAGRPKGPWYKWKRDPLTVDAVLMYAQRGHGKRSSYYSDYTFGCWQGDSLLPVGKAYFGFTDEELAQLDRWIRRNTVERFGPVRAVAWALVLEVAFDAVAPSNRHKAGLALRFPRIARIRWDKPAEEADKLDTLAALSEA